MAKKRARHAGGAAQIADDALREVLARVAPRLPDLLRCAATCRRWRRLVTGRAFLRRIGHWPDTARRPSVLAGIFSQGTYPGGPAQLLGRREPFCHRPRFSSLRAGGGRPMRYDLLDGHDKEDGLFYLARPLAARRGFLLVRVLRPGDYDGHDLHLAVCRPLIDMSSSTRLLPPPPFDMIDQYTCGLPRDYNLIGYAIVTGADHGDDASDLDHQPMPPPPFQVLVLIYDADDGFVCACTYSSDTGTWSAPVDCCRASGLIRCGPRAGVVTGGGTVHWLFMHKKNQVYYTLSISTDAAPNVSLTKIPINVHPSMLVPCIDGEEGRLSLVTIRDHGVAEHWTKQDEDGDCWRCSELADLGSKTINLIFFAESRRALLVEQGGAFSAVDLKSKERTSVHFEGTATCRGASCFPPQMCTPPVLYEMDLVFSRR